MLINNNNDNYCNLAFGMISLWNSSNFDDLLWLQTQIIDMIVISTTLIR